MGYSNSIEGLQVGRCGSTPIAYAHFRDSFPFTGRLLVVEMRSGDAWVITPFLASRPMPSAITREFDIAVIGAGVSGLSAAWQCAERGASVICIDAGGVPGGLIANVGKLDGFPSVTPLSGAALADSMVQACQALDVSFLTAVVSSLAHTDSKTILSTDQGAIGAKAVIVASGSRLLQLGVPGETEFAGRGVSQCDWCDGGFFKNESVLVVGGGDAAFQAALHLAQVCASVTIVMRSSTIKARRAYVKSAADNARIAFAWDTVVERINGTDRVETVVLNHLAESCKEVHPTSGVFVFIGTAPNSEFLPAEVERDRSHLIVTDANYRTTLAGLYAIGGVRSGYRGQLLSACGEGAAAAAASMNDLETREMM